MIHESQYWKNDLKNNIGFLHEKLDQRVWREASFGSLEKRIMLSCYIVRKLYEANKITSELFNAPTKLYTYKNRGKVVDAVNCRRLDELYEIESANEITKPFSYVINQIIHSFVFFYTFKNKNEIEGFLFNSDRSKKSVLYMVKLIDFIELLSPVAGCYISKMTMIRN